MTTLIAAGTAAATSTAFAVSGDAKIFAKLSGSETVKLQEEMPDGTYVDAVDIGGVGVLLTANKKSAIFTGYGNYKVIKSATAAAIAVGLES